MGESVVAMCLAERKVCREARADLRILLSVEKGGNVSNEGFREWELGRQFEFR